MHFPYSITYEEQDRGSCYLNKDDTLIFIKNILLQKLKITQSSHTIKLYHLIDMVGLEKTKRLIMSCDNYYGMDISDVYIIDVLKQYSTSFRVIILNTDEYNMAFKAMYNWSKQYECVINEEKADNSSMEQKLLDTTLQKIETFADIIQSYESKFDRQSAEIADLKNNVTSQIEMLNELKQQVAYQTQQNQHLLELMQKLNSYTTVVSTVKKLNIFFVNKELDKN